MKTPRKHDISVLNDLPEVARAYEVAKALGIYRARLTDWIEAGLPARRLENGHFAIDKDELIRWMRETGRVA